MAVLALLEDIANGRIRNERVFRDYYDFLAHWLWMMTGLSADSDFQELSSWKSVLSWARVWRGRRRGVTHCQFQYKS